MSDEQELLEDEDGEPIRCVNISCLEDASERRDDLTLCYDHAQEVDWFTDADNKVKAMKEET